MAEQTPIKPTGVLRHIPSALTDNQYQNILQNAVLAERERCIGILQDEIARWDADRGVVGAGWSWQKWRDMMLNALNGFSAKP